MPIHLHRELKLRNCCITINGLDPRCSLDPRSSVINFSVKLESKIRLQWVDIINIGRSSFSIPALVIHKFVKDWFPDPSDEYKTEGADRTATCHS